MTFAARLFRVGVLVAVALAALLPATAWAVGTSSGTSDAPDLTAIKAKLKAKDFKSALPELKALVDNGANHPDVFNLLGFSYRKTGDRTNGALYYRKALDLDPLHKGALEYQGEMFVEIGDINKAKANLATLVKLCPSGCEEREDLEKAIADAPKKK